MSNAWYYTKIVLYEINANESSICEFGKLLRTAVTVVIKTLIKKSRAVFSDYL